MPTILYAALRSRLVHQLQKALYTEEIFSEENVPNRSIADPNNRKTSSLNQQLKQQLIPLQIPLKQIRQSDRQQLEYVSAIALKYAQLAQRSPLQLAENLMETFSKIEQLSNSDSRPRKTQPNNTALQTIPVHFSLEVAPPGLILFRLTVPDLAVWLQTLIDRPLTDCTCFDDSIPVTSDTVAPSVAPSIESQSLVQIPASARNSTSVFSILHTHARCHSVLRLGQQAGSIQAAQNRSLSEEGSSNLSSQYKSQCQIRVPHPLPWLTPNGEFRGSDSSEWQLVEQICAALDAIAADSSTFDIGLNEPKVLQQADRLSQSWQRFHAQCRTMGEVLQADPARAQIRLGLTCITQKLLSALLRSIGLPAPRYL